MIDAHATRNQKKPSFLRKLIEGALGAFAILAVMFWAMSSLAPEPGDPISSAEMNRLTNQVIELCDDKDLLTEVWMDRIITHQENRELWKCAKIDHSTIEERVAADNFDKKLTEKQEK